MIDTYVGAELSNESLRRFLVGPKECEITGVVETPDNEALFVNIQHPGDDTPAEAISEPSRYHSHWPDGGKTRPCSATIVITRNDDGKIDVELA